MTARFAGAVEAAACGAVGNFDLGAGRPLVSDRDAIYSVRFEYLEISHAFVVLKHYGPLGISKLISGEGH